MAEEENKVVEESLASISDSRILKQLKAAEESIEKGKPDYAIDVCMGILAKHPSCAEIRKILHKAQIRKTGKENPVKKVLANVNGLLFSFKAGSLIKKNQALKVINDAEVLRNAYANNKSASKMAAKAAESLEYWATSVLFWQSIAHYNPADVASLVALGAALVKDKNADEAIKVGERILRVAPGNGDAQALLRSASVVKTMDKSWKEGDSGDFRQKLANADAAADREKDNRIVNDEESMLKAVEKLSEEIKNDVENINLYKEIIQNYKGLKDYENAIKYVKAARQLSMGKGDTSLEKLEADLINLQMDYNLNALAEKLEASPNDVALKAEFEKLSKEQFSFKLNTAEAMVERYPNDFNYRYYLGQLYLDDGRLDDAIGQFQVSQRSPKVRSQSLLGLGKAFMLGKKYDMAADQLKTAKSEMKQVNEGKKEIIYTLGTIYEAMGKKIEALEEFKEIYSIDIQYKDVAKKINDHYASVS